MRILFLLFVLGFVIWGVKRLLLGLLAPRAHTTVPGSENLVKCATCDTFVPSSQALTYQSQYYCSKSHLP